MGYKEDTRLVTLSPTAQTNPTFGFVHLCTWQRKSVNHGISHQFVQENHKILRGEKKQNQSDFSATITPLS